MGLLARPVRPAKAKPVLQFIGNLNGTEAWRSMKSSRRRWWILEWSSSMNTNSSMICCWGTWFERSGKRWFWADIRRDLLLWTRPEPSDGRSHAGSGVVLHVSELNYYKMFILIKSIKITITILVLSKDYSEIYLTLYSFLGIEMDLDLVASILGFMSNTWNKLLLQFNYLLNNVCKSYYYCLLN